MSPEVQEEFHSGEKAALETAFSELHDKLRETTEELVTVRKNQKNSDIVQDIECLPKTEFDLQKEKKVLLIDDIADDSFFSWELDLEMESSLVRNTEESCMLEQACSVDYKEKGNISFKTLLSSSTPSPKILEPFLSQTSLLEENPSIEKEEMREDIRSMVGFIKNLQSEKKMLGEEVRKKEISRLSKKEEAEKFLLQLRLEKSNIRRLNEKINEITLGKERMLVAHKKVIEKYTTLLKKKERKIQSLTESNFRQNQRLIDEARRQVGVESEFEESMMKDNIVKELEELVQQKNCKIVKYQEALVHLKERIDKQTSRSLRRRGIQTEVETLLSTKKVQCTLEENFNSMESTSVSSQDFEDLYVRAVSKTKERISKNHPHKKQTIWLQRKNIDLVKRNKVLENRVEELDTVLRKERARKQSVRSDSKTSGALVPIEKFQRLANELKTVKESLSKLQEEEQKQKEKFETSKRKSLQLWNKNKGLEVIVKGKQKEVKVKMSIIADMEKKLALNGKEREKLKEKIKSYKKKFEFQKKKILKLEEGVSSTSLQEYETKVSVKFELERKIYCLQQQVLEKEIELKKCENLAKEAVLHLNYDAALKQSIEVVDQNDWEVFCQNARSLLDKESRKVFELRKALLDQEAKNKIQEALLESHIKEQILFQKRILELTCIVKTKLRAPTAKKEALTQKHPLLLLSKKFSSKKNSTKPLLLDTQSQGIQATRKSISVCIGHSSGHQSVSIATSCDLFSLADNCGSTNKSSVTFGELHRCSCCQELKLSVDKLEEENRRLKKELEVFDMNFFDEIEDLKYKYAKLLRESNKTRTSSFTS